MALNTAYFYYTVNAVQSHTWVRKSTGEKAHNTVSQTTCSFWRPYQINLAY